MKTRLDKEVVGNRAKQFLIPKLNRKLSKARETCRLNRRDGYDIESPGPQYWEGYGDALVWIRKLIKQ